MYNKKQNNMKCPSCGKEIAEDSKFCEYCGLEMIENETITLNIYRKKSFVAALDVCTVFINGKEVVRLENGDKFQIELPKKESVELIICNIKGVIIVDTIIYPEKFNGDDIYIVFTRASRKFNLYAESDDFALKDEIKSAKSDTVERSKKASKRIMLNSIVSIVAHLMILVLALLMILMELMRLFL